MNTEAKQQLDQSMQEEQIREALNAHWQASAAGMQTRKHDIYDDYGCRRSGLLTGHYSRRMRDMAPVPATFENAVIMKSWR